MYTPKSNSGVKKASKVLKNVTDVLVRVAPLFGYPLTPMMAHLNLRLVKLFSKDLPTNTLVFVDELDDVPLKYSLGAPKTIEEGGRRCRLSSMWYRAGFACESYPNTLRALYLISFPILFKICLFLLAKLVGVSKVVGTKISTKSRKKAVEGPKGRHEEEEGLKRKGIELIELDETRATDDSFEQLQSGGAAAEPARKGSEVVSKSKKSFSERLASLNQKLGFSYLVRLLNLIQLEIFIGLVLEWKFMSFSLLSILPVLPYLLIIAALIIIERTKPMLLETTQEAQLEKKNKSLRRYLLTQLIIPIPASLSIVYWAESQKPLFVAIVALLNLVSACWVIRDRPFENLASNMMELVRLLCAPVFLLGLMLKLEGIERMMKYWGLGLSHVGLLSVGILLIILGMVMIIYEGIRSQEWLGCLLGALKKIGGCFTRMLGAAMRRVCGCFKQILRRFCGRIRQIFRRVGSKKKGYRESGSSESKVIEMPTTRRGTPEKLDAVQQDSSDEEESDEEAAQGAASKAIQREDSAEKKTNSAEVSKEVSLEAKNAILMKTKFYLERDQE